MTAQFVDSRAETRARAEQAAIEGLIARLSAQFPELPAETVARAVRGEYDGYEGSAVRDFVPVLVERSVRQQLKQPDPAEEPMR